MKTVVAVEVVVVAVVAAQGERDEGRNVHVKVSIDDEVQKEESPEERSASCLGGRVLTED